MLAWNEWNRTQKLMLLGVIATVVIGIAGIIYKKSITKNTNITSGQQTEQNITGDKGSIETNRRDTIAASGEAKVEIDNRSGLDPEILMNRYEGAIRQNEQLVHENEELKKERDNAIKRAEQLQAQGNASAADALEQIRQSGNTEKLLALLIEERNKNQNAFTELNRQIAAVAFLRGKIKTSEDAVNQILKLDPNDLFALNQKGRIHCLQGSLDKAIECYQRVFELAEKQNHPQAQAAALDNLGIIYQIRGELTKAEEMHKKALEIDEQMDNKEGLAQDYGNLGVVYQIRGTLDKAEEMYNKALAINIKIGRLEGQASQYGNLGIIYKTRGELPKAEDMYKKALDINRKIGRLQG